MRVRRSLPDPSERRALRESAGLTQQELADAIGVSRQAVGLWESGLRTPRGRFLDDYTEAIAALRAAA